MSAVRQLPPLEYFRKGVLDEVESLSAEPLTTRELVLVNLLASARWNADYRRRMDRPHEYERFDDSEGRLARRELSKVKESIHHED